MRNRSERKSRSDRLPEDEARGYVPGVQRRERSTPTVRTGCPAGEGPTSTSTTGLDRGRGTNVIPRRFGPRWLRRTNVKLRSASIPSWAKPVQQGSRTQVSMVENLGESQTVQSLLPRPKPAGYPLQGMSPRHRTKCSVQFHKTSTEVRFFRPVETTRLQAPITSTRDRT